MKQQNDIRSPQQIFIKLLKRFIELIEESEHYQQPRNLSLVSFQSLLFPKSNHYSDV